MLELRVHCIFFFRLLLAKARKRRPSLPSSCAQGFMPLALPLLARVCARADAYVSAAPFHPQSA